MCPWSNRSMRTDCIFAIAFSCGGSLVSKKITKFKKSDSIQSYMSKTKKQHYSIGKSTNPNISGKNVGDKTMKMHANV